MEIEKAEGRSKVTRTVRLNVDVDAKLIRLTELLGTTINAYLNVELGKAINRDYLQFQVADRQGAAMDNFMQTALVAMQSQMEKDGNDAK
jgi:hypothetical protein